jgi:hypothetical protein
VSAGSDAVIWELGSCGKPQVDLEVIARQLVPKKHYGIVCAEKFVSSSTRNGRESRLIESWRAVIGDKGIPYEVSSRNEIISNAPKNVRDYVSRWKQQLDAAQTAPQTKRTRDVER